MLLVEDYLLNGFLVSGFEVTMTMVSCFFILAPLTLLCLIVVACMVDTCGCI